DIQPTVMPDPAAERRGMLRLTLPVACQFFQPKFSFLAGSAHLQLQASTEALTRAKASRKTRQPSSVKSPQTVEANARRRVTAEGGNPADRCHVLSRMEVQFGQYRGTTFQWLLTHDVGYVATVLAGHAAERESGDTSSSRHMLHKDALLEYAYLFPPMAAAVEDKKRTGTDTEGDRLVGFGEHSSLTYRELYESTDPEISSYRSWVRSMMVKSASSRAALLKQYVLRRDREQRSLATSAASAGAGRAGALAAARASVLAPSRASVLASGCASVLAAVRASASAATASTSAASTSAASTSAASTKAASTSAASTKAASTSAASTSAASTTAASTSAASTSAATTSGSSSPLSQLTPSQSTTCGLSDTLEEDDELMMEVAASIEQQVAASMAERPFQPPTAGLMMAAPQDELILPEAWKRSLPVEQQEWVSKAIFVRDQTGGAVLSQDLKLWYYPPGPRSNYSQCPSNHYAFFQRPFVLWAPYRMWEYKFECPVCSHRLTGCGLYKTVRKVLDRDGWYFMGTEYLECRYCRKKVAAWSQCILRQLGADHRPQFPAVLTYRMSCDKRLLAQMNGHTLGNSVSCLHSFLLEQHTTDYVSRCTRLLLTCSKFEAKGMPPPHAVSNMPKMERVPGKKWLLLTYAREVFSRVDELRARVTSTFGSILKMDSTKKVTRKLAGADAGTVQWMTSVGNERGQVLMSVLTAAEGYGLRDMATGLQERYRQAGQDPPSVLYVDRDCCRSDGGTCATAALFPEWPQLEVRLDVWHYIRRLAAGVTTESHPLYSEFVRRLSRSIFEWDPEDFAHLDRAKNGEHSRKPITFKEMARHCRRRTRGVEATERLLDDTIKTFTGATDTMGIPILDGARMREIWRTQRRHIACIQDPSGICLYTQTGQLTKGGVVLPVYRCARGSTSLESFHLHLNRFIPGNFARACYFQMYLLEGLTRWNEDRAQQAAGKAASGMKCYRGQEQHTLKQLTQHFFGKTLVESCTKPLEYT
ncbi:Epithelial-stromal interaction 1, partial [Clarias magur]